VSRYKIQRPAPAGVDSNAVATTETLTPATAERAPQDRSECTPALPLPVGARMRIEVGTLLLRSNSLCRRPTPSDSLLQLGDAATAIVKARVSGYIRYPEGRTQTMSRDR